MTDRINLLELLSSILAQGGEKIRGPFATKELALEVRRYVEIVKKPLTFWVDQDAPPAEPPDPSQAPADRSTP
jgi:hypothetical protein